MPLYRVSIEGPELDDPALARIAAAGGIWEGTRYDRGQPYWHCVRLIASDDGKARERMQSALGTGYAALLDARPVVDGAGRAWQGPINRRWEEVDWTVPELRGLNALQRAVIGAMLDDHEPLWTILRDPDVRGSRAEVETALGELELLGLVDHRLAASGNPDEDFLAPVAWWALTLRAWDSLGVVMSPFYRPSAPNLVDR